MIKAIFLDDGGVMNDNSRRGDQWKKLIGQFFSPRFGGDPEDWKDANGEALQYLMQNWEWNTREKFSDTISEMSSKERKTRIKQHLQSTLERWVTIMFDYMEIEPPAKEKLYPIYLESTSYICSRVKSSYPGIIDAIHELDENYQLYTASNENSHELQHYLTGMQIADKFKEFFGVDLIGGYKHSTYYFEEMTRLTGIKPEEAIFVDDKKRNLDNATKVGFHVIHSGLDGEEKGPYPYFDHANQLPKLVDQITNQIS